MENAVILTLAFFAVYGIFMYFLYKGMVSIYVALPTMIFFFALAVGMPFNEIQTIFVKGASRQMPVAVIGIFGCAFGWLITEVGITETIVKKAIELGGGRPFIVALLVILISVYLLSGAAHMLGLIVIVATITVPVLQSLGWSAREAAAIQITSLNLAAHINLWELSYWNSLANVTLERDYAGWLWTNFTWLLIMTVLWLIYQARKFKVPIRWSETLPSSEVETKRKVPVYSLITPGVPLITLFVFQINPIICLLLGMIAVFLLTKQGSGRSLTDDFSLFTRSFMEGVRTGATFLVIQIVIGWLLEFAFNPMIQEPFASTIAPVIPTSFIGYVIFFTFACILVLFRGPLHPWGLGIAVMAAVIGAGVLPLMLTVGAFFMLGQLAGDWFEATPTYNVWVANFCKIDILEITLKKNIVWTLIAAAGSLTIIWIMLR